ncbi:divalent-cation tolerance protein CutA [Streptomyces sp. HNM0663]|uniref:Divalent-cation tolerance protein CutA n=1 Tax=Streptomyces chengmaiensis TaxID=3040919 RepID=A0ABT6HLA0_9ACTN|nr:divalent-cation tolerance protein CutA [Streptomyces chengmaiensis]MDH2389436.1 divalent-cation tolerance protein CutA [Streptomyces chengmaiensis]
MASKAGLAPGLGRGQRQVSTATPTRDQAIELARSAVGERLTAGTQIIGPVTSVFWHDGEFGTGEECQLLLKTTRARYPELEAHLVRNHPWQNPEVAAVALAAASKGCLDWIAANTAPAE